MHRPDSATIQGFISSADLVVLLFDATWNGQGRAVLEQLQTLQTQNLANLALGYVDVDDQPTLARHFAITNVPTVLYFQNAVLVDRAVGGNQSVPSQVTKLLETRASKI